MASRSIPSIVLNITFGTLFSLISLACLSDPVKNDQSSDELVSDEMSLLFGAMLFSDTKEQASEQDASPQASELEESVSDLLADFHKSMNRKVVNAGGLSYNEAYRYANEDNILSVVRAIAPLFFAINFYTTTKGVVGAVKRKMATPEYPNYDFSKVGWSKIRGNQAIAATFQLGDSVSNGFEHLASISGMKNHTRTFGRTAGAGTMALLDVYVTSNLIDKVPDITSYPLPDTFATFAKSVAITGNLSKAMISFLEKKYLEMGYTKYQSKSIAESITAGTFMTATSSGVAAKLFDKLYTAKNELKVLTFSQKFARSFHELYPHALSVTTAYTVYPAMISTCMALAEQYFPENSEMKNEVVCQTSVAAIVSSGFWLLADSNAVASFTKVFMENMAEAAGVGMTELIVRLGKGHIENKLVDDAVGIGLGTSFASGMMYLNYLHPNSDLLTNLHHGSLLVVLLELTDSVIVNSAATFLFATTNLMVSDIGQGTGAAFVNLIDWAAGQIIPSDPEQNYQYAPLNKYPENLECEIYTSSSVHTRVSGHRNCLSELPPVQPIRILPETVGKKEKPARKMKKRGPKLHSSREYH